MTTETVPADVRERLAIRDYLLACSLEANRQRLNMESGGHRMIARDCKTEAKAYANAAAMIEREDHSSFRATLPAPAPEAIRDEPAVREGMEYAVGDEVDKPRGYPFPGTVVMAGMVGDAQRYVVESKLAPGMLHIFAPSQLCLAAARRGDEQ